MKSYRLNIKVIIAAMVIFSLLIFSIVLVGFGMVPMNKMVNLLIDYAYLIAPTSILWILIDKYLWHTKLFQSIHMSVNIPPDIRGRWEGTLESESSLDSQKFAIEVKQTLTTMNVISYSTIARSSSILPEIAISANEDTFILCYLWEGKMNTAIKDIHHGEFVHGYTMLNLHKYEKPKILKGFYFTNRASVQTRGGIELKWVSYNLKGKLDS